MASPGISRLPLIRSVKKVEKPRPLKTKAGSVEMIRLNTYEEVMKLAEIVVDQLRNNEKSSTMVSNITSLSSHLKLYGQQLEGIYGDQLDRIFTSLRDFAKDDKFDMFTRLRLLELIELRATRWTTSDDSVSYFQHKLGKIEAELSPMDGSGAITPTNAAGNFSFNSTTPTTTAPMLGPGEVIKPSGKYAMPTKVPGKSYLKDEVVIRNSDSGKVMGIKGRRVHMIEELSETIISFQRVSPGAKERLVQITGPSEERIDYARQLIEETIRRNASPSRPEDGGITLGSNSSLNSSTSDEVTRPRNNRRNNTLLHSLSTNDASVGEYKYTVTVGNIALRITGPDLKLVRAAKLKLDEYFSNTDLQALAAGEDFNTIEEDNCLLFSESDSNNETNGNTLTDNDLSPKGIKHERICYTREFLLNCSKSPYSMQALPNWWNISRQIPSIARKSPKEFDVQGFIERSNGNIFLSSENISNDD